MEIELIQVILKGWFSRFPWLKKVKEETGMYVGVEVASAYHVYEAIKHGVDMMWIGAVFANPFAVQEVANALKGVNIRCL